MKIAIWYNLPFSGAKRALIAHIEVLLKRGHEIEVWAPDTIYDESFMQVSLPIKEHVLPLAEKFNAIKPSKYAHRVIFRTIKRIDLMKEHCRACAEEINNGGFDIALVHCCATFLVSYMSLYLKIPKVMYLQEPNRYLFEAWPDHWLKSPDPYLSFGSLNHQLVRFGKGIQINEDTKALKAYNLILANSIYSRESIQKAYGVEARTSYLGVNTEQFKYPLVEKKPYLVGLGQFQYLKGVDRAIRALSTIPKEKRPKLIWIGNGKEISYVQEMNQLCKSLNVDVEIKINVSDEELFDLISQAAAMLYTSRLEPFGLAPLEANALGTAVVGIAEGGVRETITHGVNGYLSINDDPNVLGVYIQKCTENLDFAQNFGQKARSFVEENWSLDKMGDFLEENLRLVLESKQQTIH
jgi:glycosyltransferase involved in cell wall biosynthesis